MSDDPPAEPGSENAPLLAGVQQPPHNISFATALGYWLKLGFISFGGPAGQIAIMHTELVERRRWISERRFLHALNYCMVLPGPEAQQLATYIGWLLHGTWGGIAAGVLFVLPSLFILGALSWVYVAFGNTTIVSGLFDGVKPAVVAVVVFALWRIGRRAIKGPAPLAIAAAAFTAIFALKVPFPWIVAAAGLFGYLGGKIWPRQFAAGGGHAASAKSTADSAGAVIDDHHPILDHARPQAVRWARQLAIGLVLWGAPLAALAAWQGWATTLPQMAWFFTQAALLTFGGAYAVLPYVSEHAIAAGWLHSDQMIDGLALGETTPGPLIMIVAFVGFVGGYQQAELGWWGAMLGCMVATYFTFLPSFLFILLGAPIIETTRGELRLASALSGITAAVVGVILNLALFFASEVFVPGHRDWLRKAMESLWTQSTAFWPTVGDVRWPAVLLACGALVALWKLQLDIVRVVLACGAIGLIARLIAGS